MGRAPTVVVVDVLHTEAAAFYAKYGFTPLPNDPLRLVQKMSDITAGRRSRRQTHSRPRSGFADVVCKSTRQATRALRSGTGLLKLVKRWA